MSNIIENAHKFFGETSVSVDSEACTLTSLYKDTAKENGFEYEAVEKVNSFNRDFINNSAVVALESASKFINDSDDAVISVDVFIPMGEHSNLTHSISAGVPGESEEDTTVGTIVTVYETVHDSDTFEHLASEAEALFSELAEAEELDEELAE